MRFLEKEEHGCIIVLSFPIKIKMINDNWMVEQKGTITFNHKKQRKYMKKNQQS